MFVVVDSGPVQGLTQKIAVFKLSKEILKIIPQVEAKYYKWVSLVSSATPPFLYGRDGPAQGDLSKDTPRVVTDRENQEITTVRAYENGDITSICP